MENKVEVYKLPNGEIVHFYPEDHVYLVKGKELPSITKLIQKVYGSSYDRVNPELLDRSAKYGTKVHKEIQDLIELRNVGIDIKEDIEAKTQETKNYFNYVEPIYKITPLFTEKVVVLYNTDGQPVAAGRFDLACKIGENQETAICDFKTTSSIHMRDVSAQLNLYKKAAEQSGYFKPGEITHLGAIHLSGEQSKEKPIQIFGETFFKKFYE